MLNKFIISTLAVATLAVGMSVHADSMDNCSIQIAVSSPPIELNQSVAFNITNENGTSKSLVIEAGSALQTIDQLPCSESAYTISATQYSTLKAPLFHTQTSAIGECTLKAGAVSLSGAENSVAVVFPNDFECSVSKN